MAGFRRIGDVADKGFGFEESDSIFMNYFLQIEDLFNSETANRLRWESSGEMDLPEDHICRRCCAVPPLEAFKYGGAA